MGLTDRWVRELVRRYERVGDAVVVYGLRGRVSNRRIGEGIRRKAVRLLRQLGWHDFAGEQLGKRQIRVSKETVRAWMMAEGAWSGTDGW